MTERADAAALPPATGLTRGVAAAPGWSRLIRLASRDLRGETRGFLVFILCVALGVAAITAVGALTDALKAGLAEQGRTLLGGDIEVARIHERASVDDRAGMVRLGTVSEVVTMRAMARRTESDGTFRSVLVEIKAVDAAYPMVGALTLAEGARWDGEKIANDEIVVAPELLARMNLAIGDTLTLGESELRIRGTIENEPDKFSGRAAFGPRVILPLSTLEAAGLVQPGGLMRWRYRIALGEADAAGDGGSGGGAGAGAPTGGAGFAATSEATAKRFAQEGFEVRDRRNPEPGVARAVDRLSQFLTLVGLTVMLVGGVGVANSVASYLDRKRKVIATFKSLGAQSWEIFWIYFLEVLAIAVVGILVGLVAGYIIVFAVAGIVEAQLPIGLRVTFSTPTARLAAAYGLMVALVFVLWPLGRAGRIEPAVLFRDAVDGGRRWPGWWTIAATGAAVAALCGFAVLTSEDRRIAIFFIVGLSALFALFLGLGWLVERFAPKIPRPRRPEFALALANLSGPGSLARSVILSLGVGLSLLVTVSLIDRAMVNELQASLPNNAPNYFFLDITRGELEPFKARVNEIAPGVEIADAPMLRGRIVSLKGIPAAEIKASPDSSWVLEGDRGLTYADVTPEGSTIMEGAWWDADYAGPPLVSFEVELAKGLGLSVGDQVTVNILGRNVTATIANLRTVKWESLAINFIMVFSSNTLSAAPYNMLATVTFPERPGPEMRGALVQGVSEAFPNVTALNVQDAIDTLLSVFSRVIMAIRAAGSLTLVAGAIVLAGALVTAQRRRVYQAVILKAVGATPSRILLASAAEYVLLAAVTTGVAAVLGTLGAWLITTQILDVAFVFSAFAVLQALGLASLLVLFFGGLGTWRVLRAPTARILRSES